MTRKPIQQDIVDRARVQYAGALSAVRSYIGPTSTPAERRPTDYQLTHNPSAILQSNDPAVAEQAARRLAGLTAKADALPPYPDDYEPQ